MKDEHDFSKAGRGKFWQIGETWSLLKSLQPAAVINNRLAVLADYNHQSGPLRGITTPRRNYG
jgi:hypothetical protein